MMNKIKRNIPLIIMAFSAAVGVGVTALIYLGQIGTQVHIEGGTDEALADFTLHGELSDSVFRQKLTLKDGELHNDFAFLNDTRNYSQYSSLIGLAQGADMSGAVYNADAHAYQLTTMDTALYVGLYAAKELGDNKAVRVNTGLHSVEPALLNAQIFTRNGEKCVQGFMSYGAKAMRVTEISFGGKTYFTVHTNESVAGRRGVWRIDEYDRLYNDETRSIDGYLYVDNSVVFGKASQCITLADESADTLWLTAVKDSLCLFVEKDGQIELQIYNEAMSLTDKRIISDDPADIYFSVCPQEIDTDIAFSTAAKSMVLRIEDGKITTSLSVQNPQEESVRGMALSPLGDKLLLCSNNYNNINGHMRVYTQEGLQHEAVLQSYSYEDYGVADGFYRNTYFNTGKDDEVIWRLVSENLNEEQEDTEVIE